MLGVWGPTGTKFPVKALDCAKLVPLQFIGSISDICVHIRCPTPIIVILLRAL